MYNQRGLIQFIEGVDVGNFGDQAMFHNLPVDLTTTWMEEVKGHPLHAPAMKEGHPPSSYKRPPPPHFSLTPPCEGSLSSSSIIPPWSRISEIHVPGGFIWKGVAASAALLERGT